MGLNNFRYNEHDVNVTVQNYYLGYSYFPLLLLQMVMILAPGGNTSYTEIAGPIFTFINILKSDT